MPEEKSMACHGDLRSALCSGCKKIYPKEDFLKSVEEGKVLYCTDSSCKCPIKPSVVFYGE